MKKSHGFKAAVISAMAIFTMPSTMAAGFTDVSADTEYKASIEWMQKNEIINGFDDGSFKPDRCVNRAEFLKMLYKILQINTDGAIAKLFSDTPEGEWFAPYVRAAREHNTIKGYTDGTFRPNQCVNKAEAIKMALAEFKFEDFEKYTPVELAPDIEMPKTPPTTWGINFGTKAKNSVELNNYLPTEWYHKYAIYAIDSNMVGLENGKNFDPVKGMSRQEVAEMLYRMKAVADNKADFYQKEHRPKTMVMGKAEVNFEISQILLTSSGDPKGGDTLEFDVYLERPDLELKQNISYEDEMPLTVDLPAALQPKLMYLSTTGDKKPDSGAMCDRPRFPHRCKIIVVGNELKKSEHTLLLKITFKDDTYLAKEITVPHPKALNKPEITEPAFTPDQNSKFEVVFKDVGADQYDVEASLCKPYESDGINPCLEGTEYHLTRNPDSGTFTVTYSGDKNAEIELQDGNIRIKSDFPLVFEESMSYSVTATSRGKTDGGISTIIKNSASKFYPFETGIEGI